MNIVGQSQPIHDAKAKVTGSAKYAGDMQLAGMLHAAVIFSSIPHGYIKSIDDTEALKAAGVVDIIHCFNTTDRPFNRFRTMKGQQTLEQDRVFNRHVRYVGDRVGCVIAQTADMARAAAKLVKIEYELLPFAIDAKAALSGKIDEIHQGGAVFGALDLSFGDEADMQDGAIETVTESYLSRLTHMAMEPHCCVASWQEDLEELTVWSPNQSVYGIRTVLAELFDLPYEKLRVIKTTMGGSFGAKQEWILEPVAVAASMRTKRPVKLIFNRSETIVSTISRAPLTTTFFSKITPDGKIQSLGADVTLDTGGYVGNACDYLNAVASKFFRCYSYPYAHYKARAVCTNTPMSGAYRGWSAPEMYTFMEHNLNIAARKLAMDPLELRLKNVALPGEYDRKSKLPLGEIRIKECLLLGKEDFSWQARKDENLRFNQSQNRYRRGIAVGCAGHVNGYFPRFPDYAGVSMRVSESGGVQVQVTLHDHGCGTVTAMKMIVSEVLDIPLEKITMTEGDTATTPHDVGCFASRTTYVIGRAVLDCAQKLREALIKAAARLKGTTADGFFIKNGAVQFSDEHGVSFAEVATFALRQEQKELWVTHQWMSQSNPSVTGAHFAWVEVDCLTGMVKLLDYLAVHDIGQAINREICVAQIQGAVAMGYGAALSEHMDTNPKTGKTTASMKDYHVVNAPDFLDVRVKLIEDGLTDGPFGAKSIGEVSYVPVAAAIVGAVNDALQSALCHLPITPDSIVNLMIERKRYDA